VVAAVKMALAADRAKRKRDWVQVLTAVAVILTAIAAVGALFLTRQTIQQGQQGQITDRYNAAVTNLGSSNIEVRLGGIYALQRLMEDSPRDLPTVVQVLCAFVRNEATPANKPSKSEPATDILAALAVVGSRNRENIALRPVAHGIARGCGLPVADLAD